MKGLLSIENWAMSEGLMEFYRRELSLGRYPVVPQKGVLTLEMAAEFVSDGEGESAGPILTDAKAGMVAIVNIVGTMTRYGEACSYGTEQIESTLRALEQNVNVSSIVLKHDTPGGEVNGIKPLAKTILSVRETKPVIGYAIQADSGGYWTLSQCDEIIIEDNAQAEVGSIGVYSMHIDEQAKLANEGTKVTIIRAIGSEDKARQNPYEDIPAEVLAEKKANATAIRTEFIDMVKAGRPAISGDVFSGKTYKGKEAIKLGMVDRIGSLQDAVNRADFLARKKMRANVGGSNSNSNNTYEMTGFLVGLLAKEKPNSEQAAIELVDNKVGEMTEQISTLINQRDAEKVKADGFATQVKNLEDEVKVLKPKATQFDEISAEHETNKTYVENLKNAGIVLPKTDATSRNEGGKVKSYEAAPWNAKALEMSEKLGLVS
jgi:protease IV